MQLQGTAKPAIGIVFDSDAGNRIDASLAMALLFGFDGRNEARVVALSVSKPNLKSAAYCDAIARFYAAGGFMRLLPIGLADKGGSPGDTRILTQTLAKQTAEGKPAYPTEIKHLNDTAEVAPLIRNAFTAQVDENCVVILAGPASNLATTLALSGAKDWIARKVKYLVVAGGSFPDGPAEDHIKADIPAAKKLFAEWPGQIIACGAEASKDVLFPAASIEKDFAWSQAHPIVDSYRAYKPMPYDAPTDDMAAVLYAVRPQEGYFKVSDPGTITVGDDGRTNFTPAADGRHRYLIYDPAQKDRILKAYTEIASAKPVPRRFRFPMMNQKKDEEKKEPKPAEAKPQA